MHEWALAEAILNAAVQVTEKEQLQSVTEVTIKYGELQQVEKSILRYALQQLKPQTLKNTRFRILKAKTTLKCRACCNTWQFSQTKLDKANVEAIHFVPEVAHSFVKCPKCGSPDFEIANGRGVWLESVKGAKSGA